MSERDLVHDYLAQVDVQPEQLAITLTRKPDQEADSETNNAVLHVPWKKVGMRRRREILLPASVTQDVRPIRSETRAALVIAIARGRRWLDELINGAATDVEQIATREKCSVRQVNMIVSLAFISPALVKAAINGRMPRGVGIARLRDAPAEWSRQHAMLGLAL